LLFWVHVQLGENIFDGVQGAEKMSHISAPSNTSEQSSCPDNYVYRVCCRTTVLASLSFVCLLLLCEKLFWQQWPQNIHHQCKIWIALSGRTAKYTLTKSFRDLHSLGNSEKLLCTLALVRVPSDCIHRMLKGSCRNYYDGPVALALRWWWIIEDFGFD
jgi:hypothetical protein